MDYLKLLSKLSQNLIPLTMRKNEEHKTKKVYHAKHASAKAYKRDRKSNKINPLDYVGIRGNTELQEEM